MPFTTPLTASYTTGMRWLTHGAYARIFRGIVTYCQTEFTQHMAGLDAPPMLLPFATRPADTYMAK